jgi:hypothetical protein
MTYAWVEVAPGRMRYRKVREADALQRSDLPAPRVLRDSFDKPVQSMANGKWYESKRALAATHKASGNPHGVDFIELGNEAAPTVEHRHDEGKLRDNIREAIADVKAGRVPDVVDINH